MTHTVSAGVIQTARLDLIPLALPLAAAIVAGVRPPGVRWTLGYPTESTLMGASLIVTAHNSGEDCSPYTTYQMIQRETGLVVGDCGFDGPPNADGTVRVAVESALSQRRRGFAREGLQGIIRWALARDDVLRVVTDTARTNQQAIRVIEGAGMRRYGVDESLVYYEA